MFDVAEAMQRALDGCPGESSAARVTLWRACNERGLLYGVVDGNSAVLDAVVAAGAENVALGEERAFTLSESLGGVIVEPSSVVRIVATSGSPRPASARAARRLRELDERLILGAFHPDHGAPASDHRR